MFCLCVCKRKSKCIPILPTYKKQTKKSKNKKIKDSTISKVSRTTLPKSSTNIDLETNFGKEKYTLKYTSDSAMDNTAKLKRKCPFFVERGRSVDNQNGTLQNN